MYIYKNKSTNYNYNLMCLSLLQVVKNLDNILPVNVKWKVTYKYIKGTFP